MWQSKLSFAVGLVLSAGSSIAVAETEIQAGQAPQSLALSVAEFVKLGDDDEVSVRTADAPARTAESLAHEQGDSPVKETGERRVLSFSLVEFVEKAVAAGTAGEVPRISLVDLVASEIGQEATETDSTQFAAEQAEAVEQTEVVEPLVASSSPIPPPTTVPDSTQLAAQQHTATGDVELPASSDAATLTGRLVPPASLAQHTANSADPVPLALPLSTPTAAPPVQDDAVQPGKLQLFDAVRSALNEHPAIVESLSRLDAQQEQISVARAGYWPQLRSGINTGYRHTTGRSEEAFTVSASQMLYDFGKVSSAVDAAARGVDREEASVLLAAEDLIRDTAQAFIEARRYEVLLDLATEQIDAIAELEALAAKRSALGASSVSDQMQARSRRESARATQLQMQAQRDQWHRALENLIGSRQVVTLDDAYPEPLERLCPQLPENFESAPRVVIAEAERAEAEAAIRQARAEQRPTLSLNADFEHYLNRDTEGLQRLDDQEFVVSLNLTSNLFQGGALRARSRAADHALHSATAARDRALLELSRLYRETRDRARSLTSSLALQDERHDSIVKTQELYRHQYLSLGTRTLLDILNTEQEIFQTQVDKQNTLFDLRSLQIDCLYSVGGLRETFRAGDALNRRVVSRRAEVRS